MFMNKLDTMKSNSSKSLRKVGRQTEWQQKGKGIRKKGKIKKYVLEKIYTFRKQKKDVGQLSLYPLGMEKNLKNMKQE